MNLTFLIAGLGFVAVAGILYYFTNKSEQDEIVTQKKQKETPVVMVPVYEVKINKY
jgi:hypothetical protein